MNSNNRNIKFIVGKAGTAKTTTIIDTVTKLVKEHPFKKVAIIAFTHQAINNIKLKLKIDYLTKTMKNLLFHQ